MAMLKRDVQRLRVMLRRQAIQRFSPEYEPAQRATVAEAPSISRAYILQSAKLGREVHLLSTPEMEAALLALYHPRLFELQEQRLLSTGPAMHPLDGHPKAMGLHLAPLPGTLRVLEGLGKIHRHPTVRYQPTADPRSAQSIPWPYIGDLLLYLEDDIGPYCVNWTVKKDPAEFRRRGSYRGKPVLPDSEDPGVILRHRVEALQYGAAGIRTVEITPEMFARQVIDNLRFLFLYHGRQIAADWYVRQRIVSTFASTIGTPRSIFQTSQVLMSETGLALDVIYTVLYQAIWRRDLEVDLFTAILPDLPLQAPTLDVCEHYASLFARTAP